MGKQNPLFRGGFFYIHTRALIYNIQAMKTTTCLLLLFFTFGAFATVRTVSSNPATLGQFSTIQAAIDASADGDSVYVYGSPNTYAAFIIQDKKITVIGPGWSP